MNKQSLKQKLELPYLHTNMNKKLNYNQAENIGGSLKKARYDGILHLFLKILQLERKSLIIVYHIKM